MAQRVDTAFVFDLDGTLVDSVYQHVLAWQAALEADGIEPRSGAFIEKIGMSGGLLSNMLLHETGQEFDEERVERLQRAHADAYKRSVKNVRPLPGARELLQALGDAEIPFAIATSGRLQSAAPALETLRFDFTDIPIVTRDDVKYAKPDPDLFLRAAERLKVGADAVSVVGDSVWDMLAATRARFLGSGCCPADTDSKSSNVQGRIACSPIPPTCSAISTRSEAGGESARREGRRRGRDRSAGHRLVRSVARRARAPRACGAHTAADLGKLSIEARGGAAEHPGDRAAS
jgi:HAD superfamily hydrolase (TIGR01549 family)